ncbi:MAG: hypothetical protein AVDCRST_MAG30-3664, partial [uncultured Solirubrobacteraceae bacterium]
AGACGSRTPSCPRGTGSRTCCSRCAPTSTASPPSRTSPSAGRAGACGAGCPSAPGRAWTPRAHSPGGPVRPR